MSRRQPQVLRSKFVANLIFTGACCLCLFHAAKADGQVVSFSMYPQSLNYPIFTSLSADGRTAVGREFGNGNAPFVWAVGGGVSTYSAPPHSFVSDVSGDGSLILTSGPAPFVHRHSDTPLPLQDLYGYGASTSAISDDGRTVVGATSTFNGSHMTIWDATGHATDLHTGEPYETLAWDVNGDGRVISGSSMSSTYGQQPIRWTAQTGIVTLPVAPGTFGGVAAYIDTAGEVIVGMLLDITTPDSFYVPAWWDASGVRRLPLPEGAHGGSVGGISDGGHIVIGSAGDQLGYWVDGGAFVELRSLLTNAGYDLTGWSLAMCPGISDDGRTIVGSAYRAGDGYSFWVLTIPGPTALPALGLGVALAAARRHRQR